MAGFSTEPLPPRITRSRAKCNRCGDVIGLAVAIGLGVYLVYTLVHPEKF